MSCLCHARSSRCANTCTCCINSKGDGLTVRAHQWQCCWHSCDRLGDMAAILYAHPAFLCKVYVQVIPQHQRPLQQVMPAQAHSKKSEMICECCGQGYVHAQECRGRLLIACIPRIEPGSCEQQCDGWSKYWWSVQIPHSQEKRLTIVCRPWAERSAAPWRPDARRFAP